MNHDSSPTGSLQLPAEPSLDKLRKDAKRLWRDYRAGDDSALQVVGAFHPRPDEFGGLRDAQWVIARRYGYESWDALSNAVELRRLRRRPLPEQAEQFILAGCLRYTGDDRAYRYERAAALLEQEPGIAGTSIHAALVAGDTAAVAAFLADDASLASKSGGPFDWPPLLYLTYSRVHRDRAAVLEIADLLFRHGANPDAFFVPDGVNHFSALTGVMGEGERGPADCPPHPFADDLAERLLTQGADCNERQGLYNTLFTESGDRWLATLIRHGLNESHRFGTDGTALSTLSFVLAMAVSGGRLERARLALEHGADPGTQHPYAQRPLHVVAVLAGHDAIAELLLAHGAQPSELGTEDRFRMACRALDRQRLRAILEHHPNLTRNAGLLREATAHGIDLVLWLAEQGFDLNSTTRDGRTLLHHYAWLDAREEVATLVERGADPDLRDRTFGATSLGFALHNRAWRVADYLLPLSRDIHDVCRAAEPALAAVLLAQDRTLVSRRNRFGATALHLVSQSRDDDIDVDASAAVIDLLLEHGADREARDREGLTPIERYARDGKDELVEVLRQRGP